MNDTDRLKHLIADRREAYLSGSLDWPWDRVIITAASERQAEGYRRALQMRHEEGFLPESAEVAVIHDLDEQRIGSGGATMQAAAEAACVFGGDDAQLSSGADLEQIFSDRRVLVIHCGGDSKRIPQYSAIGKVFATFPNRLPSGRISTLFDEWLMALCGWAGRLPAGILAVSGDVLITLDPRQLNFSEADLTGVACPAPWQQAINHGIFVTGESGKLTAFLQKPSEHELRAADGIRTDGTALIDTGVMALSPRLSAAFAAMGGADIGQEDVHVSAHSLLRDPQTRGVEIDLYDDIACRLSPNYEQTAYVSGAVAGRARARRWLIDLLDGYSFSTSVADPAHFLHMGTTEQFRDVLIESDIYDFPAELNASLSRVERSGPDRIYDAVLAGNDATIGPGCVIEKTDIRGHFSLGAGSVVSAVEARVHDLQIAEEVALSQTPVRCPETGKNGLVTRIHGVSDNPKYTVASGQATLFGRPILDWLKHRDIAPETIWSDYDPEAASLWEARLYPVAEEAHESLRQVEWMQRPQPPRAEVIERWQSARRLSLREISARADCSATMDREETIRRRALARHVCHRTCAGECMSELVQELDVFDAARLAQCIIEEGETFEHPLQKARVHLLAAHLDSANNGHRENAFRYVGQAVRSGLRPGAIQADGATSHSPGWKVECAARIDFGGGWSDTPPYSLENGGTVLNAAVLLDGEYPIRAITRRISEPIIRLCTVDGDTTSVVEQLDDLRCYGDPGQPLNLHRAVACSAGLADTAYGEDLQSILLNRAGGGIELISESRLPRGCGLGGSSIVIGVLLTALHRLLGRRMSSEAMFRHILHVEQMMTTGGGWQDQVGAMTPGLKLITTSPGCRQRPVVQPLKLDEGLLERLHDHLVLFNVGRRRLGRNILRTIMGRYLAADPTVTRILREIQDLAREMKKAVEDGDFQRLGHLMRRHWDVNKTMDPHSSNPYIERLFEAADPFISGGKLAGAGGGGFMMLILKKPYMRRSLIEALSAAAADSNARDAAEFSAAITDAPMRIRRTNQGVE